MSNDRNKDLTPKLKKAYIGGTFYHTAAHTDTGIDFTLEAYGRSLEKM